MNGVRVISGGQVHIEKCIIRRFNGASPNGFGIQFVPPAAAELFVSETYLSDNGAGGSGGGIQIRPTGATNVSVVLNRVEINNNTFGLALDGSGSTGSTNLTLSTSVVAGNTSNGISSAATPGGAALTMMISGSLLAGNAGAGVNSSGAAASGPGSSLVLIGGSTVTANATGVSVAGAGVMQSFKNNIIAGNGSNGTPITAFPGPGGTPLQ